MKRFVNFFTCFIVVILFFGMSLSDIFAFSTGPLDGRTGSPADGGNTCNASGCHNSFGLNSGSAVFSINVQSNYSPGEDVTVTVSFTSTTTPKHGFELSALDAENNHVGVFSAIDSLTQVTDGKGEFIKHTKAGDDQSGEASWQVTWTAPSSAVTDPVTFYAAGNEADGSADPTGDYIYTATKSITLAGGGTTVPVPDIKANGSDGPVKIRPNDNLKIEISLSTAGASGLADTGPADWWLYVTTPFGVFSFDAVSGNFVPTPEPVVSFQGTLPDFGPVTVLNLTNAGLPLGNYVFNFSADNNVDGVKDDTYKDSVTVTVDEVSFSRDILPHFSATDGNFQWFNYGPIDITNGSPATGCGNCHGGNDPPPGPGKFHLINFNTHEGWLNGIAMDNEPMLGESSIGATDYNWEKSVLRHRLRDNRMPPGWEFKINQSNRNGPDIVIDGAADSNDLDIPGQFSIKVDASGNYEYSCCGTGAKDNAVDLIGAWVMGTGAGSDESATVPYGGAADVTWDDVKPFFNSPNTWYHGSMACTACHGPESNGNGEEDCPGECHFIDFSSADGLRNGADAGAEPLLGESSVGATNFNWDESKLRQRLRDNRMPPNAPFDLKELTRDGPNVTHPITGEKVDFISILEEWVNAGAKDN